MAGKGDKWRQGTDFDAYRNNFDAIFKPKKADPCQLTDKDIAEFEENRASMSYSEFSKIKARGTHVSSKINGLK